MFSLIPWRKEREGSGHLAPRTEYPLSLFRREMGEWLERFLGHWPVLYENGLEVKETEEKVIVRTDAPGYEPAEIDVRVSDNILTIKAEHKVEGEGKTPTVERWLERAVTLPTSVDPAKVEAKYHNGVLELTMPRIEPANRRKVEVMAT
jgi:HSP20 family protein